MATDAKDLVKRLLPPRLRGAIREGIVARNVTQLYGPKRIRLNQNEAAVTCVVRNGEFYVEAFIKHYSEMGFRHIFFLDNGSTDDTISIAKKYNNVSVCVSTLPIDSYQSFFKRHLAQKSIEGGWCLDADIDELFDYPYSSAISLRDFLDYLNKKHYTAVITQLLDMFSDEPVSHLASKGGKDLRALYEYYDLSDISKIDYRASELAARHGYANEISQTNAAICFGGIRKTLYGNNCLLTKHSLFFPGRELELFPHVHFVNKANLADVSCLMLHYKLTSNALDIALQNKERFVANSAAYTDFINLLLGNPDFRLKQATAVRFRRAEDLIASGVLFMSDAYRKYVGTLTKQVSM